MVGKARGVLRAEPSEGVFVHERHAPAPDLAPFVEHFWFVSWELPGGPVVRETLPHPSVHVVFERGSSRVAGVPRGRFTRTLEGTGFVLGIKFRPGGFRPLLPYAVTRLSGRVLPLDEVFASGAPDAEEEVLATTCVKERIGAATRFLRERLPDPDPVAEEAATVVRRILEDPAVRRVEDLARAFDTNPRSLQRLFREYVGVSPKWVIRRYRLHEALERMDSGARENWTALALDLGYFDQAHFIRDFRALVGRTPASYDRT
ncbi:MAG: helix-turn-helix transcriptional regulator [Acidobacteria bacterium]|nr:helix-turn-helix transcriptional regulator [Acidobacteriota bacterium]